MYGDAEASESISPPNERSGLAHCTSNRLTKKSLAAAGTNLLITHLIKQFSQVILALYSAIHDIISAIPKLHPVMSKWMLSKLKITLTAGPDM